MFILCAVVVERIVGPKDLQVSELSYSSLQLTWSQATGDVTGYRLLITPVSPKGHLLPAQQRQVRHAHLSICTPHAAQQMEGCTWTTFVDYAFATVCAYGLFRIYSLLFLYLRLI